MSSSILTTAANAADVAAKVQDVTATVNKSTLKLLAEGFTDGLKYVKEHKKSLATIGQVGGAAALVAGGAALLFSGIGANLTILGTPLGVPLMIAGGILLAAGTILQISHQVSQEGSTVGEKIKNFFLETLKNISIGSIAGAGVAFVFKFVSLPTLALYGSTLMFLGKDLNKEDQWQAFCDKFSGNEKIHSFLKNYKNFNELLEKLGAPIGKGVKTAVEAVEAIESKLSGKTENAKDKENAAEAAKAEDDTKAEDEEAKDSEKATEDANDSEKPAAENTKSESDNVDAETSQASTDSSAENKD